MKDGLPVGSMVHTERGMVAVELLLVDDRVMTCYGLYEKVVFVQDLGKMTLLRIMVKAGNFRCAPNRLFAVLTFDDRILWVSAKLLKPGMRLITPRTPVPGGQVSFPGFPHIEVDEELAHFVGHYASTGNFSCFANNPQEIETIVSMFQKFKKNIVVRRYTLDNGRFLMVPPSDLRIIFEKHVVRHHVPSFIWNSMLSTRIAFAQGAMAENKFMSPEWANMLRILFSSCGIEMKVIVNGLKPSNTHSKEALNRLFRKQYYHIPFWKKMCCWKESGPFLKFFGTTPVCGIEVADRSLTMDLVLEQENNFYTDGYLSRPQEVKKKENFFLS